ncbi:MAG: ATP synthase subunit I [Proteobacteria bacterium]|nr:ATP synthase subunit I [Pseudomonadota bacterium]
MALLLLAAATLGLLTLQRAPLALGLAVGGLLGVLNFWALRRLLAALVASARPWQQAALAGVMVLKLSAVGVALWVVLRLVRVDAVGFLGGVSVVVLAILIEGLRLALRGDAVALSRGG